ncbi:hypothetical protein PIB30_062863 [Stylosanthes scabra]|uniref:Uncharacterized protein n=1 Tax=Stylosanthes scabra TaxID=79078 RepID=A0ABU6QLN1_9FABA|nr:hypothetical protein [Stylosanthes scabra]
MLPCISSQPPFVAALPHQNLLSISLSPSRRFRQSLGVAVSRALPPPQDQNVHSSFTASTTPSRRVQSLAVSFYCRSSSRASIEKKKILI